MQNLFLNILSFIKKYHFFLLITIIVIVFFVMIIFFSQRFFAFQELRQQSNLLNLQVFLEQLSDEYIVILKQEQGPYKTSYISRRIIDINPSLSIDKSIKIANLIVETSKQYNLDPFLVAALIEQESRFNPRAKSHKGAIGLGQLLLGTAKDMGVNDPYDIKENILGTCKYLQFLFNKWESKKEQVVLALASYNAGFKNVERYEGVPPFKETENYIEKITDIYNHHNRVFYNFDFIEFKKTGEKFFIDN
ncbi:MAG: lytic transglycosylase domain-containing protein [bacterium]